jgi:hypothetical protein
MSGRARASAPLALGLLAAAAVSCAHAGPDTCGGYSVERQMDQRFRVTVTAKVTAPPQWKLDEDGNPTPASFGGDGVTEARALYTRLAHERCLELGYRDHDGRADLEWPADKSVTSVSTCADPGPRGKRTYAIRIWGDRIRCVYTEAL